MTVEPDVVEQPAGKPRFPTPVWLLLIGDLIIAIGVGLTQPYVVVLLHEVHGLSLAGASALWALGPVATIIANPIAGTLIDRFGARFVMVTGLTLVTVSGPVLAYGPGLASAVAGVMIGGVGWSCALPALGTRLAILTPETIRPRVYTLQYVFFNLGMAAGAAIGGIVFLRVPPDTEAGRSVLPLLWVAASIACLVTIAVTMLAGRQMPATSDDEKVERTGYRRALADRALIRLLGAGMLLATIGYGIYNAAPSVIALAADDPAALSFASVANCVAIVVGSPLALRLTSRISPRAALLYAAGVWAVAWTICVPTAVQTGLGTRFVLTLAAVLVGIGELLFAGALPTLINGLAPDELRGRYNALSRLALTTGTAAGPLLTSAATASGSIAYVLYIAVALAGLAAILLMRSAARAPEPAIAAVGSDG